VKREVRTSASERLRGEFADDDVQERDEREREYEGNAVNDFRVGNPGIGQDRLDQTGEGRFTDPAETERCQRDAELARRKVGIQMGAYGPQHASAHAMGLRQFIGLGTPQLDDRELGRDEEAIQQDEQQADRGQQQVVDRHGKASLAGRTSESRSTTSAGAEEAPCPYEIRDVFGRNELSRRRLGDVDSWGSGYLVRVGLLDHTVSQERPDDDRRSDQGRQSPVCPDRKLLPQRQLSAVIHVERRQQQHIRRAHPGDVQSGPTGPAPPSRRSAEVCRTKGEQT
jgi:hypothetical protein